MGKESESPSCFIGINATFCIISEPPNINPEANSIRVWMHGWVGDVCVCVCVLCMFSYGSDWARCNV